LDWTLGAPYLFELTHDKYDIFYMCL